MLSTKDIPVGGGKLSKTIKPGNILAKILDVSLQPLRSDENAFYLMLHLEGEDQGPDFEGFLYDKDRPELGRAKGQVGKVRYSMYPYRNGVTKNGKPKSRDFEILRSLVEIATLIGKRDELDAIQTRDIFDFVKQTSKIVSGHRYYYWCIGGSAYMKDDGHKDFSLSLPKYDKNYKSFEVPGSTTPSQVATFNYSVHVDDKIETETKTETSSWTAAPTSENLPSESGGWTPAGFEI
jgi:hypothetical protein